MFFDILTQFGLPVAAAITMGVFIYIILKYILGGVVGSVKGLHGIIMGLENRIDTMNNDLIHIDTLISAALHLKPDLDRIARSDGKNDARKRLMPILEILNQYGFATLAAIAMGWFIWFIYTFITQEVTKKLSEASGALIQLLDKIRRLDNDLIRIKAKLNTVLTLREQEKYKNKD